MKKLWVFCAMIALALPVLSQDLVGSWERTSPGEFRHNGYDGESEHFIALSFGPDGSLEAEEGIGFKDDDYWGFFTAIPDSERVAGVEIPKIPRLESFSVKATGVYELLGDSQFKVTDLQIQVLSNGLPLEEYFIPALTQYVRFLLQSLAAEFGDGEEVTEEEVEGFTQIALEDYGFDGMAAGMTWFFSEPIQYEIIDNSLALFLAEDYVLEPLFRVEATTVGGKSWGFIKGSLTR